MKIKQLVIVIAVNLFITSAASVVVAQYFRSHAPKYEASMPASFYPARFAGAL
jgi:hypothetical protein